MWVILRYPATTGAVVCFRKSSVPLNKRTYWGRFGNWLLRCKKGYVDFFLFFSDLSHAAFTCSTNACIFAFHGRTGLVRKSRNIFFMPSTIWVSNCLYQAYSVVTSKFLSTGITHWVVIKDRMIPNCCNCNVFDRFEGTITTAELLTRSRDDVTSCQPCEINCTVLLSQCFFSQPVSRNRFPSHFILYSLPCSFWNWAITL